MAQLAQPAPLPRGEGQQPLNLAEAITQAAHQNLELQSHRLTYHREQYRRHASWEAYSPTLLLRSGLARDRPLGPLPPSTHFTHSAGVLWRSLLGTEVSVEALMASPIGSGPDAPHTATLVAEIAQPLLRDAWLTGAALPIREAELHARLQRELFRDTLNALLVEVESAYWDLAVAEADVEIKTRSRDRAQQQFEDTAENIRRGILADIEIYVVQENVVFFERELVQAKQNLQLARRNLAELLRVSPDAPLTPADALEPPELATPVRDVVLQVGLASNPRLLAQRLSHSVGELRQSFARNQALPSLDLTASMSFLGADPGYPAALRQTVTGGSPDARVGLLFSLPLDRGAVSAGVQLAQLETSRQDALLKAEEQRVRTRLLDAITVLETSLTLLDLSRRQLDLAELKLNAETEKYRSGISTLTDVVRFQRDLDDASTRLRRTIRSVYVARASLLAAQGTLHEAFGLEVQ